MWHLVQELHGTERLSSISIVFGSKGAERSGVVPEKSILPRCETLAFEKKQPNPSARVCSVTSIASDPSSAPRPAWAPLPRATPELSAPPALILCRRRPPVDDLRPARPTSGALTTPTLLALLVAPMPALLTSRRRLPVDDTRPARGKHATCSMKCEKE
jgi:hypothetical protein